MGWHRTTLRWLTVVMIRFFTLLLISIAVHQLQAIDRYNFKGDVFTLGDLLATEGDDRLKKELSEFRDNQNKVRKIAGKILSANKGILDSIFSVRDLAGLNGQQLKVGVARSKTLIKVADDYQATLDEYEKFVNKTYKDLNLPRSMKRTMAESFILCRDWADNSRILAVNAQVYFEYLINGAIPVEPSKAKDLVALLGEKVELTKKVDDNRKAFDREKAKLELAEAELTKAKDKHAKAKTANFKAIADMKAKKKNLEETNLSVMEKSILVVPAMVHFLKVAELVEALAADRVAKGAFDKSSAALTAASKAFADETNATDSAKTEKADALEEAKDDKAIAKRKADTAYDELTKIQEVTKSVIAARVKVDDPAGDEPPLSSRVVQEKNAKKVLGLLEEEKGRARLAFEGAKTKLDEAKRLFAEAKSTVEKGKPEFEDAQRKLEDSTAKERLQREEFDRVKMNWGEVRSALSKVKEQISLHYGSCRENCRSTYDRILRGYVKPNLGLANDLSPPFVR
jgi:hypothetical protein